MRRIKSGVLWNLEYWLVMGRQSLLPLKVPLPYQVLISTSQCGVLKRQTIQMIQMIPIKHPGLTALMNPTNQMVNKMIPKTNSPAQPGMTPGNQSFYMGQILPDQEVIFSNGSYEVSKKELHSLLVGRLLEPSVMDTVMYIMHCFNQEPGCTWSFVRCMHTHSVPNMPRSMLRRPEYKAYRPESMKGRRWVFLPIQSDNHWLLMAFDFYEFNIKVYNSHPDTIRFQIAVRQAITLWKPFLHEIMGRPDVMNFDQVLKTGPPLNNKMDVGLYILKIIDYLIANRPVQFLGDAMKSDRGRVGYNLIASAFFPGSFPPIED